MKKIESTNKIGTILAVEYTSLSGVKTFCTGILYKKNKKTLYLGHTFHGKQTIDITRIPTENIQKTEIVVPKNIYKLEDLKGI